MPDNDLKRRIEQLVDGMREEIVGALCQILRFRTVSGSPDEQEQQAFLGETENCLKWLEQQSRRMGFEWRNHDNKCALADLPAGESFVGLPVHIDVVPPGDGWSHDPFGGEVDQGYIWGRGCQDDKGPVVQMLYAMHVLKALNRPLGRGARLIVGTQEECGDWADIKHYFTVEKTPQISIVSDAGFPIINGEKGMLNLKVQTSLEFEAESQPGGYQFVKAWAGERANIVPHRAELRFTGDASSDRERLEKELTRFLEKNPDAQADLYFGPFEGDEENEGAAEGDVLILFHGRAVHGSTPKEGHNAAVDMLKFLSETSFASEDEADLADFLYRAGEGTEGEGLNIDEKHPFIGATTVNLGICHWLRGDCYAIFNIRNTLGLSVADAIKRSGDVIAEFAEETGFPIDAAPTSKTMEPIYVDPAQYPDFIDALKDAYTTFTGRPATLHAIGGTTYAKVFPNAVCFGPVDPVEEQELAHQADERVKIEHLLRNIKIYAYALARLCAA